MFSVSDVMKLVYLELNFLKKIFMSEKLYLFAICKQVCVYVCVYIYVYV